MANIVDLFKTVIWVQLFYAVAIVLFTHNMPGSSVHYVEWYSDSTATIDLESVGSQVEDSLRAQADIPVIELGALVFYSGNIILDLLANFAFAIPAMLGLLVEGFTRLFSIDGFIAIQVQLFASVLILVMYVIGLVQLVAGIRSGRIV